MKDYISKFSKSAQVHGSPYVFALFSSIKDKIKGRKHVEDPVYHPSFMQVTGYSYDMEFLS